MFLFIGLSFLVINSEILFLIMMGIVYLNFGAWLSIAPISTRRLFGAQHYTKHYGYMFSAYGISAFVGTWSSSYIFEAVGLNGLYIIAAVLLTIGLVIAVINHKVLSI